MTASAGMQRRLFEFSEFTIEYTVKGSGKIPVLAFHGFGRDLNDYAGFENALGSDEYLVAMNLFAHGKSAIPPNRDITQSIAREEFSVIFQALLDFIGAAHFGLMGYSMGGRIALSIFEWMPERVTRLVLMASDGLKTNHLANFTTETRAGKALQAAIMRSPGLLLQTTNAARKLRLIDKKLHRFVHVHMGTEKSRRQVHAVWYIYRHFKPNLEVIAREINLRKLPFLMIFGKFDSVIRVELGERFVKLLDDKNAFVILETGHQLMGEALDYLIAHKPE